MIVPAEQAFQDRFRAARLRMTTGIAIKPKRAPIMKQQMRGSCAVTVRGWTTESHLGEVAISTELKGWPARRRWRLLAASLPILIRNDRALTAAVVRVMWKANVTWADIVGSSRQHRHVKPRHEIIHIVHSARPTISMPSLGRLFGGRDHTTILNSLGRLQRRRGCA